MYGWRARIGIVVSPPNTVAEPEFNIMAPEGVSIHATRMYRTSGREGVDRENLQATNESLPQVVRALAPVKPDALVFAHTMGSMVLGPGHDHELTEMLSEAAGCPAITTAGALLTALELLGVRHLSLVAPYREEMVEMEKSYLEQSLPGLKVVKHTSFGISDGWEIGNRDPLEAFRGGRDVDCPEAEAVFISGTNLRAIESIEPLEQDLGKPVLTGNQVGLWAALRLLGVSGVEGYGSLFSYR